MSKDSLPTKSDFDRIEVGDTVWFKTINGYDVAGQVIRKNGDWIQIKKLLPALYNRNKIEILSITKRR